VRKFYHIKEKLGTGSFAVVKRAIRKSDSKQFAVKCIKKAKLNAEELAGTTKACECTARTFIVIDFLLFCLVYSGA
jgi:serine/threonine protein kinase